LTALELEELEELEKLEELEDDWPPQQQRLIWSCKTAALRITLRTLLTMLLSAMFVVDAEGRVI
jgi:hypothetical protein